MADDNGELLTFVGARIFDGNRLLDGHALVVRGGRVLDIAAAGGAPAAGREMALDGGILSPGFVDLQVNGGGGAMVAPDRDALARIAQAHGRLGATTILPTLITDTPQTTQAVMAIVAGMVADGVPGIAGLHLEGPHIARAGAHDPALLRPLRPADTAAMTAAAAQMSLMVTLAPEAASPEATAALARAGIVVALGHTDALADECSAHFAAGARGATHLYNAMSQLSSRAPGLVGAALSDPRVAASIIADGHHVAPAALRTALLAKPDGLFVISDAMAVAGTDDAGFTLGARRIARRDGTLRLADGTLAGADLDLSAAIRHVHRVCGAALETALAMATSRPAALMGWHDVGRLTRGARADLVHLADDLTLAGVWQAGLRIV